MKKNYNITVLMILFILSISFFSFADSQMKMIIQASNVLGPNKIFFSNDGSMFATISSTDKNIKIWSIKGRLLHYFVDNDATNLGLAYF